MTGRSAIDAAALLACQLVVAGVFATSAAGKLRAPWAFAASLAGFGVPARRRRVLAVAVIAAEAACVPLVLVPATTTAGLLLAVALLVVFTFAIARVLRRGDAVRCRCFGGLGAVLHPAHVWRNLGLAATALAGATLAAGPVGGLATGAVVLTFLVAAVVLVLLATLDGVLELLSPTT